MNLIAYSLGKDNVKIEEPFNSSKYTLTRPEVLNSSLEIKGLESGDSVLYFCATSGTVEHSGTVQHLNSTTTSDR